MRYAATDVKHPGKPVEGEDSGMSGLVRAQGVVGGGTGRVGWSHLGLGFRV